jgi:hypothetical protein
MPYKDPAKQREYVQTWRRKRKLQETRAPAQHIVRYQPAYRGLFPQPAVPRTPPAADQKALKMSPDGAPQTGRAATQAYRMHRGQATQPSASLLEPPGSTLVVAAAAQQGELIALKIQGPGVPASLVEKSN